jgi:hypothetical protein
MKRTTRFGLLILLLVADISTSRAACPISLDVTGTVDSSDATQTGRVTRTLGPSDCDAKAFPGIGDSDALHEDAYSVTNPTGAPVCVEVTTTVTSATGLFTVAYQGGFQPGNPAANYLGDPGASAANGGSDSFAVSIPAGESMTVVVSELYPDTGGTYRLQITCAGPVAPNGSVLIDEYRLRGPSGALDEYVDLYNNTDAPIVTQPGWTLFEDVPGVIGYAAICAIPTGTMIPARGHLLLANSLGYSISGYPSGAGIAVPDLTWSADVPDGAGLLLCRRPYPSAKFTLDAVGYTNDDALFREGAGMPTGGAERTTNLQYAFTRRLINGMPQDTNDNASDFVSVETAGTAGMALGARLGAPGPRNLESPIASKGAFVSVTQLFDPQADYNEAPNAERAGAVVPNGSLGTYEVRRAVTNNSGSPITRLRFRIAALSTLPPLTAQADLRALSSTTGTVTRSDGSSATVQGTTLEEPPLQAKGGGVNATLSVPSVTPASPLLPGQTIYVRFRFGVETDWNYFLRPTIELVPETVGGVITPAPDQPPAIHGPGALTLRAGGAAQVPVAVFDADAGNGVIRVTLSVFHGTLSLHGSVGVSFLAGSGRGDALMTVSGATADINDALARMVYRPNAGFEGTDTLTVTANDLGLTGAGGPRQTTATTPLHVSTAANLLAIAGGLAGSTSSDVALYDAAVADGRLSILDAVTQARNAPFAYTGRLVVTPLARSATGVVYLDDPAINGRPSARVMVIHDFVGAYVRAPLGVYYEAATQRWLAFTENGAPLPDGETVFYAYDGLLKRVFRGAGNNSDLHATLLNDAALNGQAGAFVLAQHQITLDTDPSALGSWYTGGSWYVYNEDQSYQTDGEAYVYLDAGAAGGRITRTTANAYFAYGVYLDDPRLNNNPNAVVFAQHMYHAAIVTQAMGVWYSTAAKKWVAYNEDPSVAFPNGESVNYWVVK